MSPTWCVPFADGGKADGGKNDVGAGLSIGKGIMVLEWQTQMPAHIRQLGRTKVPGLPGDLHRAEIGLGRRPQAGLIAAGAHHTGVKTGIVGGNEMGANQAGCKLRP
jgi:hypothetical protein